MKLFSFLGWTIGPGDRAGLGGAVLAQELIPVRHCYKLQSCNVNCFPRVIAGNHCTLPAIPEEDTVILYPEFLTTI